MCLLYKLYFFLHELIAFYEQASSRTSWLKAFFCKPCCLFCVFTPLALRPQHETPGPPLPVICVRLMMISRMISSMLLYTANTPLQCLFAGDMSPYSQRQEHRMFLIFRTRTTTSKLYFFYMNWFFFMSRLAVAGFDWRPFLVKPCKPWRRHLRCEDASAQFSWVCAPSLVDLNGIMWVLHWSIWGSSKLYAGRKGK